MWCAGWCGCTTDAKQSDKSMEEEEAYSIHCSTRQAVAAWPLQFERVHRSHRTTTAAKWTRGRKGSGPRSSSLRCDCTLAANLALLALLALASCFPHTKAQPAEFTDYVNEFGESLDFSCQGDNVLVGAYSTFSTTEKDRK